MNKLRVSILDLDILMMKEKLMELKSIGIRNIHLDVIDTSFSDNISFGLSTLNTILEMDFTFDIHFMIKHPEKIIKRLNIRSGTMVTLHTIPSIEYPNLKVGIALDPNDTVESILHVLHKVNHVLVMSVNPGYGGQLFNNNCIEKIKKLKELNVFVVVDGGINAENIESVKLADFIVIGSFITKAQDAKIAIDQLIHELS